MAWQGHFTKLLTNWWPDRDRAVLSRRNGFSSLRYRKQNETGAANFPFLGAFHLCPKYANRRGECALCLSLFPSIEYSAFYGFHRREVRNSPTHYGISQNFNEPLRMGLRVAFILFPLPRLFVALRFANVAARFIKVLMMWLLMKFRRSEFPYFRNSFPQSSHGSWVYWSTSSSSSPSSSSTSWSVVCTLRTMEMFQLVCSNEISSVTKYSLW